MSEFIGPKQEQLFDSLTPSQYRGSSIELMRRWEVYKYVVDDIDFYGTIIDNMHLQGNETVLDLGCATGDVLQRLRQNYRHKGILVGLDIDEDLFMVTNSVNKLSDIKPITFVGGEAQHLPFPDDSFDASMALFMLYHVPKPHNALAELQRVTKPGGKIAIATSGAGNKARHRYIESLIANELNIKQPPRFAASFDFDIAKDVLPEYFTVVEHFEQSCAIQMTMENYEYYIDSLTSMKNAFNPPIPADKWVDIRESFIRPFLLDEIKRKGFLKDWVERHYFICENSKRKLT